MPWFAQHARASENTRPVFVEAGGLLVIEAEETATPLGRWVQHDNASLADWVEGFTGKACLQFQGNSESSGPVKSVLTYYIEIKTPGRYKLAIRGLEAPLDTGQGDKGNDCYARMVGQDGWQGRFRKHVLIGDSFEWSWRVRTEIGHHKFTIPVYELDAGIHAFQIAGRSKNFFIDRIVLYPENLETKEATKLHLPATEAVARAVPESVLIGAKSVPEKQTRPKPSAQTGKPAPSSPWRASDRIAISMDGNGGSQRTNSKYKVADPDDIGASAVALALIAKRGLQDRLVHFDFNNWLDVGPVPEGKDRMTPSVIPARDRFGFTRDVFFDLTLDPNAGIEHLTQRINESTADSRLFIVVAGPIESVYRAVAAADPDKLLHVTLVSHSNYNETERIQDRHRTISDFATFREQHGLGYLRIRDQNAIKDPTRLWHVGKDFEPYAFLRESNNADLQWLFSRIKAHNYRVADVSDAGMVYFLLTGDSEGNPRKLEAFLDGSVVPETGPASQPHDASRSIELTAADNFPIREVEGFKPAYFDERRNAMAVDAFRYPDATAAARGRFAGATGRYDLVLTTLTEVDGESTYRIRIDDKLIGELQNPANRKDYSTHEHVVSNVLVRQGASIQIESNAVSNGKVPEGDAFAYARGRWRSLVFKPATEEANPE